MKNRKLNIYHSELVAVTLALLAFLSPSIGLTADYPPPGDYQRGAKTWANNCARCHNIRDPRDLRDDQWITSVFHMRIRAGLTGQQTRDILTFLQKANDQTSATSALTTASATKVVADSSKVSSGSSIAIGKKVYNQTCIACHGADGTGSLPGAPDLTQTDGPLAKSDDTLFKHIIEGFQTPGSPMAMPAKGGNADLNQDEIRSVLGYIRKTFGEGN